MKSFTRFTLFAAVLLLGSYGISVQIGVGIRIGPPPAPRVVVEPCPSPGPDFIWVDGYWYPAYGHYRWREGYWTRAPYPDARWIGPRHEGGLSTATGKAIAAALSIATNGIATMTGIADTRINTTTITEVKIQFATHRPRHL